MNTNTEPTVPRWNLFFRWLFSAPRQLRMFLQGDHKSCPALWNYAFAFAFTRPIRVIAFLEGQRMPSNRVDWMLYKMMSPGPAIPKCYLYPSAPKASG